MKKLLILLLTSVILLTSSSCTRKKTEIDWVVTILFYILNQPKAQANAYCRLSPVGKSTSTVYCKEFHAGFESYMNDKTLIPCDATTVATEAGLPAGVTYEAASGTVNSCPTDGKVASCAIKNTDGLLTNRIVYYSNETAYTTATAQTHCTSKSGTIE